MSLDGFLTFLALLVALPALASNVTRLTVRLRGTVPLILSLIAGVLILYFEFFDVTGRPCMAGAEACGWLVLGQKGWLSANQVAFLIVMVWCFCVWLCLSRRRLLSAHLPRLARLAEALATERRYSEFCELLEPHLDLIAKVHDGKRGWAGLRSWVVLEPRVEIEERIARAKGEAVPTRSKLAQLWRRAAPVRNRVAKILPSARAEVAAASALMRMLYRRPDFTTFLARNRPAFALKLAAPRHSLVFDFTDGFFASLLSDPGSPLFMEVRENQNEGAGGYWFPDHNPILKTLVGDAKNAERLGLWDPIRAVAIGGLRQDVTPQYRAYLNGPATNFSEEGRWSDRTFVCIRVMDLMVDAALRQEVTWHMWLFEMPEIVEALIELYDVDPKAETRFEEWPTRAAYLLYAAFDAMTDWIAPIASLPDGNSHLKLKSEEPKHQNENIPKSAILALSGAVRAVLLTDRVEPRFKRYLVDLALHCLRDLPSKGNRAGFRRALQASLVAGGVLDKSDHHAALLDVINTSDPALAYELKDLRAALGE